MYFDGNIVIDKRPHLADTVIKGSCGIFAQTASGIYNINVLKIPWEFAIKNELLIVNSAAYFFDMPVLIQNFPPTLSMRLLVSGSGPSSIDG